MCGIIHKKLKGDARNSVFNAYTNQKSRGIEGFGFVALNNGKVIAYERSETEEAIKKKLAEIPCNEVLFHHRLPTSTPNIEEANHPIKVENKRLKHIYYVIHNGIISSDMHDQHLKEGFTYSTEMIGGYMINGKLKAQHVKWNDSETLAIELAKDLDQSGDGISLTGSIAFIALQTDLEGNAKHLFWGRNDRSPLVYENKDGELTITSERATLTSSEKTCPANVLFTLDYSTGEITERKYKVGKDWDYTNYYNRYDNYGVYDDGYYSEFEDKGAKGIEGNGIMRSFEDFDLPDEYFVLIEEAEELKDEIRLSEQHGEDTAVLEADLFLVEEKITKMEELIDNAQIQAS
jgi:glucosamine 6-phosphate synthetase-like amidotransferase/phosphosugar isomerase protein